MLGACWRMLGACWAHAGSMLERAGSVLGASSSVQVRAPPPVTRPGSRGMAKSGHCLFCESPFSMILGFPGAPRVPRITENGDSQNKCLCVCRRQGTLRGRPEKGTTDRTLTQISGVAPPGQLPINRPRRPLCYSRFTMAFVQRNAASSLSGMEPFTSTMSPGIFRAASDT